MTPQELKRANIERFERLLRDERDAARREAIERMLAEERIKAHSAYPETVRSPRPPG
jgi:hypothetical protein